MTPSAGNTTKPPPPLDREASGAGESHPRALSEPDVHVSAHPAPISRYHDGVLLIPYDFCSSVAFLPRFRLMQCNNVRNTTPSLHRHYPASTLIRVVPPLWVFHLDISLRIRTTGSQVPYASLNRWARCSNASANHPVSRRDSIPPAPCSVMTLRSSSTSADQCYNQ